MNLTMNGHLADGYKSAAQIARVVTEDWVSLNLYCPACTSNSLKKNPTNTQAIDLTCPQCFQVFQLKSGKRWNQYKVVDAAFRPMIEAIRSDRVPNLLLLQYSAYWQVQNLVLIPYFFFSESIIEPRKPLKQTARRAGWVGCNILVGEIPSDGKLALVAEGRTVKRIKIRERFLRLRELTEINPDVRGWILDVLRVVRRLEKPIITLSELYKFESHFKSIYPENQNVKAKIRQQLQRLRDLKFIEFLSNGQYRIL